MTTHPVLHLPSPAKVNTFLHVLDRRPDGYHNLQTGFQFLDFCDEMSFQYRDDGIIQLTPSMSAIPEKDNLILKAANHLKHLCNNHHGANITIKKYIPMGAGLGGGSSNAATTLLALNDLWDLALPQEALLEIGIMLGADVPIFLFGHAAWAEGIGEKLTTFSPSEPWYLLIHPNVHINTTELFRQLSQQPSNREHLPITTDFSGLRNDFEALILKQFPEVQRLVNTLRSHTSLRLTGTGSVMYATFDTRAEASTIASLAPANCHTIVTKGENISPLHAALAGQ
ncbi:MAG: 4-(cytidine 5'-diphospho)-2-C-methyl-D-erythritol kinase [Coxiellaceae bacterium]|nr:4-(cytidine 5'-diphospho)-2-C-methyl-D-erythritol kinase [Coxiellaceae bacterium]